MDNLIKEQDVADLLNVKVGTVRQWRFLKKGPPYVKLGNRLIRYERPAVEAWMRDTAADSRRVPVKEPVFTVKPRKAFRRLKSAGGIPKAPEGPGEALAVIWNENRGTLPACRGITEKRRAKAVKRLEEVPDLDRWARAVKRLAASNFCCGRVAALPPNKTPWIATFDFLLDPNSLASIETGVYDNRETGGLLPQPPSEAADVS